jgi:putative zinc finger/helix-turn-helix YgiT family protein
MKCKSCNSTNVTLKKDNFDTRSTDFKGNNIVVADVESFECADCGDSWITPEQLKRIRSEVDRLQYELLSPEQIKMIRESLPISTKRELSEFLCLNEKAFVKWEKGYTELNRANDLLIRLIARSRENFDFVKELHDKKFRFELSDYSFLKKISVVSTNPKALPEHLDVGFLSAHSNAVKPKKEEKHVVQDGPEIGEAA